MNTHTHTHTNTHTHTHTFTKTPIRRTNAYTNTHKQTHIDVNIRAVKNVKKKQCSLTRINKHILMSITEQ